MIIEKKRERERGGNHAMWFIPSMIQYMEIEFHTRNQQKPAEPLSSLKNERGNIYDKIY